MKWLKSKVPMFAHVLAGVLLALAVLTACAGVQAQDLVQQLSVQRIAISDTYEIVALTWTDNQVPFTLTCATFSDKGGMSCDWERLRRP